MNNQPYKLPTITPRDPKKLARASYPNEIAEAVKGLATAMLGGAAEQGRDIFNPRFYKVVRTGPKGTEADFTDERYWLSAIKVNNPGTDAVTAPLSTIEIPPTSPDGEIIIATNPGEVLDHSHSLAIGTPVYAVGEYDKGEPPKLRYVITGAGGGSSSSRDVPVTKDGGADGDASTSTPASWTYSFTSPEGLVTHAPVLWPRKFALGTYPAHYGRIQRIDSLFPTPGNSELGILASGSGSGTGSGSGPRYSQWVLVDVGEYFAQGRRCITSPSGSGSGA